MTSASKRRGTAFAVLAGCLVAAIAMVSAGGQAPAPCPVKAVETISSRGLADVCIPDGFDDIPMEYFDDFSWRAFLSVVWPAAPGKRGVPASKPVPSAKGPLVFETDKALWEVFHTDGSAPTPSFATYDQGVYNACGVTPKFGDLIIGSFSGVDDIGQVGNGVLDAPLVAQNGRYVRTLTFFNQIAYDFIVAHKFYLRSQLPVVPTPKPETPVMDFPMGSMAIKTAWIDVTDLAPEVVRRMYTRQAVVKAAAGTTCSRVTVGLVGMHIAQKTPSRPQWIWSTFEHEDNVPPARPNGPGLFTFNDGKRTAMPASNPLKLVPLAPEPATPFNVTRSLAAPIHTATDLMTFRYQALLKDTPWRYYKLVMTQWPRLTGNQATFVPASLDGTVPNTFPGVVAFSSSANVTMETFDQDGVQLGCMNCHNRVRMTADFMWTVMDHAYPARFAPKAAH